MKKSAGFTLIELLAVIVILAIIALIATPIIMNIINESRRGAFKDTAHGIIKAGELYQSTKLVQGQNHKTEFNFSGDVTDLNFKGEKPGGGTLRFNSEGQSSLAIYDKGKNWCAKKTESESDITITDYVEGECTVAVAATDEDCFEFSNGVITNYKCGYYTGYWGSDGRIVNTGKVITDVVIPERINGQLVTEIASYNSALDNDESFASKGITSVKFPKTVTKIGESAFEWNELSGTIDLGEAINLEYLGRSAFGAFSSDEIIPFMLVLPNKKMNYISESLRNYLSFQKYGEETEATLFKFMKGSVPVSDIVDDYNKRYPPECGEELAFKNIIEETNSYVIVIYQKNPMLC